MSILSITLSSCQEKRELKVEQHVQPVEEISSGSFDLPGTAKAPTVKSNQNMQVKLVDVAHNGAKINPEEVRYPDRLEYYKQSTTSGQATQIGRKEAVSEQVVANPVVHQTVVKFPGWKYDSEFDFPVIKFTKGEKQIFLVALPAAAPQAYFDSVKIWAAKTANEIGDKNSELNVRYEIHDICNDASNDKVLFPNHSYINSEKNRPIFLKDHYGNLSVNGEIFVKDTTNCKTLKTNIKTMRAVQKTNDDEFYKKLSFKKVDSTFFDLLKTINNKISASNDDLTQNEYKNETDKMRFAIEYVCSRRAREYGPAFCPILVNNGIKDLRSEAFQEFKEQIYWKERTDYLAYSALNATGEVEALKNKGEFDAIYQLSKADKNSSHLVLFWHPGRFEQGKEIFEGAGFAQDHSYQEVISFGKCQTSGIYHSMINSEHKEGAFYKRWNDKCY